MEENRSSISDARSYEEIGEFWDNHDLADYWEQTEEAYFEVEIRSERRYFLIEHTLADKMKEIAVRTGVSTETLLNLWVRDKIEENVSSATLPV